MAFAELACGPATSSPLHPQLRRLLSLRNVSLSFFLLNSRNSHLRAFKMIFFWALLLFARVTTSATPDAEVAWYSAPNFRGTWDLIVSCVLTLVICVWSALHLNVPVETSRLKGRNIRRLRWILLGIFAPEVVVSTAFAQYLTARSLRSEIRKDIDYRSKHKVSLIWCVRGRYPCSLPRSRTLRYTRLTTDVRRDANPLSSRKRGFLRSGAGHNATLLSWVAS